jgi:hypothetical protein
MKKNILALDISTSIIGLAWQDEDGQKHLEHIDLKGFKGIFPKMRHIETNFDKLFPKCDAFVVEAAAKAYSSGRTTTSTIFALVAFNLFICYLFSKKRNLEAKQVNVRRARRIVGIPHFLDVPTGDKRKRAITQYLQEQYSDLNWLPYTNQKNPEKADYDRADALVILLAQSDFAKEYDEAEAEAVERKEQAKLEKKLEKKKLKEAQEKMKEEEE